MGVFKAPQSTPWQEGKMARSPGEFLRPGNARPGKEFLRPRNVRPGKKARWQDPQGSFCRPVGVFRHPQGILPALPGRCLPGLKIPLGILP